MLSNSILTFKALNFETLKLLHKFIKVMQSTKYYNLKNKFPTAIHIIYMHVATSHFLCMHIKYNYVLYMLTYIIIHVLGVRYTYVCII